MNDTWILLMGGVLLVLLITPGSAASEGAPGTGGFAGRQAIAIDHPSGTEGLEVLFNATYLPGMRPDFADIRFLDGNETAIPHWTATVMEGSHAHVWLALPANATTITMLYGNPAARDAGDPDAVFLFYEDYERGDLSRWSFCGSNAAVRSDVVRSGGYAGDINVSEPDLRELANNRICLANISAGPIIVEGDFLVSKFGKWCGSGYIQAWSGPDRLYALHLRNGSVQYYDGAHRNFSADARAEEETWYHIKVALDTPNATGHAWMDGRYLGKMTLRFADGSPVPEETIFTDIALIGSSAWGSGDPHHFCADNVVVRNYVPVEPVLSYEVNAPGCTGDP
ncbi:MAG TPA: DUF2341 domain-containing protein [Methanoculleus sp.]|jgi:hypothetical protein|uniref:DUF2341 domain-containing protein n=1 Tax=Methanoculleus sp. TaxID=90427 RepID=UPI001B47600D|nr:DUF2341 domain-containing protein [Methanoculleus sp.]MBP7143600.1 DUF2341 domain-containing protein [Methanoculleus sp.]HOI60992.1 DUF2341 domain-containing protein [Methanoculleus sp.]HQL58782.1 DUF2341 domain-containing protein [Methanoculleus sp.]